jgi:hypothetical protein
MTLPKTIVLQYPTIFNTPENVELPLRIHTRPSASEVVARRESEGLSIVVFRSAYDALFDIYVEACILGEVGQVKNVWLEEAK